MSQNVALIEISASHEDALYSQLLFMKKSGCKVFLIISTEIEKRMPASLASLTDEVKIFEINSLKGLKRWKAVNSVRKYLLKNNINRAMIYTASGKNILKLALLSIFNRKIVFTGGIHHADKLTRMGLQWIISLKIKKYFVLNDYILENISKPDLKSVRLSSFYPMFFPCPPSVGSGKDNILKVVIPGALEFKRRAYEDLLDELKTQPLHPNIKFVIAGNARLHKPDGQAFVAGIKQMNLENQFSIFDRFISYEEMFVFLEECNLVLPLMHPRISNFDSYFRYQISGSFNLAFGFYKPMLMHDVWEKYEDFRETSIFYEKDKLVASLNRLAEQPEILYKTTTMVRNYFKLNFEYQRRRFMDMVLSK